MSCKSCKDKAKKLIEEGTKSYNSLSSKGKEIADGWLHVLKKHPEVELVAKAREKICDICPHKVKGVVPYCGKCTCPIVAKVRSMSTECPDDPPRWKKYYVTVRL